MGLLLAVSKRSISPEVLTTGRDNHRYEGIVDTFVQLFSFCIAVLIANADDRRKFNSGAPVGGEGRR